MGRVCSRPQASRAMGQRALLWPERTVCVKREAQYRKRCITAQKQSLWGSARVSRPRIHPT